MPPIIVLKVQKLPISAEKSFVGSLRKALAASALAAVVTLTSSYGAPAAHADDAPTGPAHASEVSIFYYPWYATPEHDGHVSHWEQNGHNPPEDIGANFYPAAGIYSSADGGLIDTHMQQIAAAGIDTVVVSWWGRGSYEDAVLQQVINAAKPLNINVAAHIEPYKGRSDATLRADHDYLYDKGVRDFYYYQVQSLSTQALAQTQDIAGDDRMFGEAANEGNVRDGSFMQWSQDAHLNGVYTYDPRGFDPSDFAGICNNARTHGLLCMPSVGPGWDGTRATKIPGTINRRNGGRYDEAWQAAIDAHADIVTVTSFNEWHEGTQIEPAVPHCIPNSSYCYSNYEGAYGLNGNAASYAYLNRTLYWSSIAKGRPPTLSQRLSIVSNAMRRNDNTTLDRLRSLKVQPE